MYLGTKRGYVYQMLMISGEKILEEAHGSQYSIHPCATKMYCDLREVYWWDGLKKDIEEFVSKCPKC